LITPREGLVTSRTFSGTAAVTRRLGDRRRTDELDRDPDQVPVQAHDAILDVEPREVQIGLLAGGLERQSIRSNTRKTVIQDYKDDVELLVVHCPDTGGST
jgi:hypothetical protein